MFFDKGFACLHFRRVEQVYLGNFGSEVRTKFDGMVIGVVGRELIMVFSENTSAKSLHHSGKVQQILWPGQSGWRW